MMSDFLKSLNLRNGTFPDRLLLCAGLKYPIVPRSALRLESCSRLLSLAVITLQLAGLVTALHWVSAGLLALALAVILLTAAAGCWLHGQLPIPLLGQLPLLSNTSWRFPGGYLKLDQEQHAPKLSGSDALQTILKAAQHCVVLAWLLAFALVQDSDLRLMAGIVLVTAPGVPWWEMAAAWVLCMLWLLRQDEAAGGGGKLDTCFWGPTLILLVGIVNGISGGLGGSSSNALLTRRADIDASLDEDAESDLEQQGPKRCQETPVRLALRKATIGFDKAVHCIPSWSPPSHKDIKSWIRHFSLREDLLAIYVCSVRAKLTFRGSLYLSIRHACFRGYAVIGRQMQFVVSFHDIENMRRGSDADNVTLILRHPLLMRGQRDPVTSIELGSCREGTQVLMSLVDHYCTQEGDGDTPGTTALTPGVGDEDDREEDAEGDETESESEDEAKDRRRDSKDSTSSIPRYNPMGGHEDVPFKKQMEVSLAGLNLAELAKEMLAEDWMKPEMIFVEIARQHNATEITVSPWVDDPPEGANVVAVRIREMDFRMPLPQNVPLVPPSTKMTLSYRFTVSRVAESTSILMESSTQSHDVPFGQNFLVQERTEFRPSEDGSSAQMTKCGRVVFLKSCGFLQGKIQKTANNASRKAGEEMVSILKRRLATSSGGVEGNSTCMVHIYELQKRSNRWRTDWQAPDNPRDGEKRWRYVDTSYNRHMWMDDVPRHVAALAPFPPVWQPPGYTALDEWKVSLLDDKSDTEGWQYADSFSLKENRWRAWVGNRLYRRRLWTCQFSEDVKL